MAKTWGQRYSEDQKKRRDGLLSWSQSRKTSGRYLGHSKRCPVCKGAGRNNTLRRMGKCVRCDGTGEVDA